MGRKGMKSFLKSAMKKHDSDDDEQEPSTVSEASSSTPTTVAEAEKPASSAPALTVSSAAEPAEQEDNSDSDDGPETRGKMVQRHKKEMLAFKKQIQRMKKSKDELAKLTKELEDRHAKELKDLEENTKLQQQAQQELAKLAVEPKKPSKAMKRKEKLAQLEAEREARIAEEKANLGPTQQAIEEEQLLQILQPLGLAIRDIRADGHCLYRSLEDQLQQQQQAASYDVQQLRSLAAQYIRQHKDDFVPFIYDEDVAGDPDEQVEEYCQELEETAAWGGQLELGALAQALQQQIKVYAVGMPPVTLGEEHASKGTLQLCYLRHAFGLGEHYNSVMAQPTAEA